MNLKRLPLILALAAIALQLMVFSVRAETLTAVRVSPEYVTQLHAGDTFSVEITVENGVEVSAIQVDLSYDPYALDVVSVEQGTFLSTEGQTLLAANYSKTYEDEVTMSSIGKVRYAEALVGNMKANGNGVLCKITFEVLSAESSTLHLIQYNGNGKEGTYFGTATTTTYYPYVKMSDIVPDLHDGQYGPLNPPRNDQLDQDFGTVKTSTVMPLAVLSIAVAFVAARRIARKKN